MLKWVMILLGLIWIVVAVFQDLKKREIANWLNFSLVIFALGFRFFYSLFEADSFNLFYQGVIGFGIFWALGNLLYYGKMFAGGDAKLMMSLGAILPFYGSFSANLEIFILFFMLFLFSGAIYGLFSMSYYVIRDFKIFRKKFSKRFYGRKYFNFLFLILGIIFMVFGFYETVLFYLGIFIFVIPLLYISAKVVDDNFMVKKVKPNKLTEGDWLYKDLKIGGKIVKANWNGLSKKEIDLIKKSKKDVLIKYGVPFAPAFLVSYSILIYFVVKGISFF
jgi:Flp pilus assembly protein protease CpaA